MGYLQYMQQMGKLLVQKKKFDKTLRKYNRQKDEGKNVDKKIEETKEKIK